MQVAILRYNAGNITSVEFALKRLGVGYVITDEPQEIMRADKIIFPGVGQARAAMDYLRARKLDLLIANLKQPVLGICLGMQLLCAHSEEGDTPCLGIVPAYVKKFSHAMKIPQIGWNTVWGFSDPLFASLDEPTYMYYVHGYYVPVGENTIARTEYGITYSAAIRKANFWGVQFHPEKSAADGTQILKNFLFEL
ncbi:MAG: imidazole glycerol phosphate synthase subunit HisH [Bacteroidia bacterium]